MKNITVIMSTYNGGVRVIKQLDSIFEQVGVSVNLLIRDDGSTDNTWQILEDYKKRREHNNIILIKGDNCGWERSFLKALASAPKSDYYAFSDQDDIWMSNKLEKSIKSISSYGQNIAAMFHCNRISCDENLVPLAKQAPKISQPLSLENAITQEYAQGCTIVINNAARDLVCRHFPKVKLPHDFWTGLICYYFGIVVYSSEPLFYHINHGGNASNAGHIRSGQLSRLKSACKSNAYPNPAHDLLIGYPELVKNKKFLQQLSQYKKNFIARLTILFNPKFKRVSFKGTFFLKLAVIIGKIE